jgi:hypothetical protein
LIRGEIGEEAQMRVIQHARRFVLKVSPQKLKPHPPGQHVGDGNENFPSLAQQWSEMGEHRCGVAQVFQHVGKYQRIEGLANQISWHFVFDIAYPAMRHMSLCEFGLDSRMGYAEYIAFRVPGLDQNCVIACTAADVKQAIAALTKQIN